MKLASPDGSERARARIADVARRAAVSIKTVSRVLNDAPNVRPETRDTVRRAMADLDYVADIHARRLAGRRLHLLGIVVPGLAAIYSHYLFEIVRGTVEAAEARDLRAILVPASSRDADPEAYVRFLREGFVDGVVVILRPENLAATEGLARAGLPAVAIDDGRLGIGLPTVETNNYEASRAAVEHLIALGHRRIAHIAGDPIFGCTEDRRAGYRDAMVAAGLDAQQLVVPGDFRRPTGRRIAADLFGAAEPPTALFCACDDTAQGAIDAAQAVGLRVGHDVSVVGFNDAHIARETNPPLTTVHQPLQEFGRRAVQVLLERMESTRGGATRHVLPSTLVVRASSGPPGASRPVTELAAVE